MSVTQRGKRESYLYECNLVLNDETPYLRSCNCNSEEAKPPNPRYQVEPGNEILEPLALVENGARAEIHRKFPISISKVHKLILLTL